MSPPLRRALGLVLLFLGTLLLYGEASQLEFLSYDDDTYVTGNPNVRGGLSGASVSWAFSSISYACNWHPITWLSHMLDVSLFGLENPGAHHLTNVVLHGVNALLLVLLFGRLTGRWGASWMLGALFAWHPQRVESVAWISERKDVLAVLFGLLSLLAFYRWALRGATQRRTGGYWLALGLFALGLMAKPLLVTLPGCMLLLDQWPAKRGLAWRAALTEKLPFIALSAGAAGMTLWSQSSGGCTQFIADGLSLGVRLENGLIAYMQYLGALFYPRDLVVFYPHPAVLDPGATRHGLALLALTLWALLFTFAWCLRRQAPYGLVGLLWFLGVLFPMLGAVQVGGQAMADRYTYFSSIGLCLPLCFAASDLLKVRPNWRLQVLLPGLTALGLLAWATRAQVRVWQNDRTLFGHAVEVDERNYIAQNALGTLDAVEAQRALQAGEVAQGQELLTSAIERLGKSVASNPRHFEARVDLGAAQILAADYASALKHLELAVSLRPTDDNAQFQLALAHYNLGSWSQAEDGLVLIQGRNPSYPKLERLLAAVRESRARAAAREQDQ